MDWPAFAKRLLLDDGRITERETELIRRAVLEDGVVDREEAEFLVSLKRSATTVHPSFDTFLFEVLRRAVLQDGAIGDAEARWLRRALFADHQVTGAEAAFIESLRREAKSVGPEFVLLCKECSVLDQGSFSRT